MAICSAIFFHDSNVSLAQANERGKSLLKLFSPQFPYRFGFPKKLSLNSVEASDPVLQKR